MDFANDFEIDHWLDRYRLQPGPLCAALTLRALADPVNSCTDGWASWPAPCKAAQKLIALLREADDAQRERRDACITTADLKIAYRQIKAFATKNQAKYGFEVSLYYPAEPAPAAPEPALALF